MTPEETVRAQLDAWGRLDVDEIMSFFTEDIVLDFVPFGPVVGREKVRKAVEAYVGRMTSGEIELLNLAVAGNVVLTERIDHFCWDGEMFHSRCMGTLEIVGDKICAWRDYFDMSKGGH